MNIRGGTNFKRFIPDSKSLINTTSNIFEGNMEISLTRIIKGREKNVVEMA